MRPSLLVLLTLTVAFIAAPAAAQTHTAPAGRIVFAAARGENGATDIFSSDLAGETIVNLTADEAPDRSPSWSPDGKQFVFASRRDRNWDLYLMQADGSGLRRLTDHPAYDGEPTWSPRGDRIAFTSTRDGNAEIYVLELANGALTRLTNHPAADFQPAWAPDATQVAFTSWRDGNQEVYRLILRDDHGQELRDLMNISDHPAPDHSPAWAPDGRRLAFVSNRDGVGNVHVADVFDGTLVTAGPPNRNVQDVTWTPRGGLLAVATWSASGRGGRQGVMLTAPDVVGGTFIVGSGHGYGEADWSASAIAPTLLAERTQPGRPLAVAVPPPDLDAIPRGLVEVRGVRSGGMPALAAAVEPSFQELRQAVIETSGYDFLGRLSEAGRAVEFRSGTSSYASWHKAGRAFDTVFDYSADGRQVLFISPEYRGTRLFWRLYLRAAQQDGTQGEPLFQPVFSPQTRQVTPPPAGYFVDFTALAAQHGWSRIAAQERDTFDWRSEPLALEYWHFERRDGLSWGQAMGLVYEEATLARLFSVERLAEVGVRPSFIPFLGLPWAPAPPPVSGPILRPGRAS
jgi:TolB protein